MNDLISLTDNEAGIVETLCLDWRDFRFQPEEVFPCRDNIDNARRRTIDRLAQKGVLNTAKDVLRGTVYSVTDKTFQAHEAWLKSKGGGV